LSRSLARWLETMIERESRVIVVQIANVLGSAPRDTDALMMVTQDTTRGTIGGGALEWTAIEHAREMIANRITTSRLALPLGPFLGQCCGGHVTLDFFQGDLQFTQTLEEGEQKQISGYPKLMIFGAGHVGKAIAQAFIALPFSTRVLDTRVDEVAQLPLGVSGEVTEDPVASIEAASSGTSFLVLTHSHTLDFLATEAALKRSDSPYVGMIGSATKRARFRSWIESRKTEVSLCDKLICPIGGSNVRDKRPEVIAALVAAELITKIHFNSFQGEKSQAQQYLRLDEARSAFSAQITIRTLTASTRLLGCTGIEKP
jgi:xanthine dehydrogenase accessory factor